MTLLPQPQVDEDPSIVSHGMAITEGTRVIAVWYLVGWALDRRRGLRGSANPTVITIIAATLLLAFGGFLLVGIWQTYTFQRFNNPYYSLHVFLIVAWAVVLIFVSGRWLVRQMPKLFAGRFREGPAQ